MLVFILIFAAILVIGLGIGAVVWFVFRRYQPGGSQGANPGAARRDITFRWSYIAAPLVGLLLSAVVAAVFYRQLPSEVGYHFGSDGTPDKWLSREMATTLLVVPQLFLALMAGGITWGLTRLNFSESAGVKPQRMLKLMGNVAVIPQIILGLAMLDIFSYNTYRVHIMPMWAQFLILGLATVALIVFLGSSILKARKGLNYPSEERK